MPSKRPKIIVVGAGISGSMAALSASSRGADITLITPIPPRRSRSACIREGLAAALDAKGEGDSSAEHARDTIACGGYLANQAMVKRMCEAAPSIVNLFDRMGAMFIRTPEGTIEQGRSCGSKKLRVASAGASTGHQIISALDGQIRRAVVEGKLTLLEGWEFLSPVIDDSGTCRGAVAINLKNMDIRALAADAVILCSGGCVGLFGRRSTHRQSTGAAAAACFEMGARFANPEFIQLHPYSIQLADKCLPIGESALCIGARASIPRDGRAWYFLEERFPSEGGLLPSDIAAREMAKAIREAGHEAAAELEVAHLDDGWLSANLSDVLEFHEGYAQEDPSASPLKISPAAHKTLGGLWIDANHATNIPGLFAAGECALSYHGACALGGNEILASAFGGRISGESAASYAQGAKAKSDDIAASLLEAAKSREEDIGSHLASHEGGENAHVLAHELSAALWPCASAEKDNKELATAAEKVESIAARFAKAELSDKAQWANSEVMFMRRLSRAFDLARLTIASSIARDESRGSHHKPRFPERNDKDWLVTTTAKWTAEGPVLEHTEKVEILDITPPLST